METVQLPDLSPNERLLCLKAIKVSKNAYKPYSKFPVGAALLTHDSNTFVGCNVECADYLGLHAEHNAIGTMIAENDRSLIQTMAVVLRAQGDEVYATPCGGCRQKIREHSPPNTRILGVRLDNNNKIIDIQIFTIQELYPYGFGPDNLHPKEKE